MPDDQNKKYILRRGKPHDSLFKSIMEHKIMAIDFFENFLPEDIKKRVDLSTLKIQKNTFTNHKIGNGEVDVLFSVKFDDEIGYLYIVTEHQTKQDDFIPLRLYEYVFRIWQMHRKKHRKIKKLPLVMPIVYYTGEATYKSPESLWDLFSDPELAKSMLAGKFTTIDIQQIPDERIELMEFIKVMIYAMKYVRSGNIVQYLRLMETTCAKIREMKFLDFEDIIFYLLSEAEAADREELVKTLVQVLSPKDEEKVMTLADYFREEGMQKGIQVGKQEGIQEGIQVGKQEGIQENKQEIAKNLLAAGVNSDIIQQATGLSIEEIRNLM